MSSSFSWSAAPMRRQRCQSFAVIGLLVLLIGLPTGARVLPAAAQDGDSVAVRIVDFAFEPASATFAAGTTVTWTNGGDVPHTVTADGGAFDSAQLDPSDTFRFTFDAAGTIAYRCSFHPSMTGTIVVAEGEARDLDAQDEEPAAAETPAPTDTGGEGTDLPPVEEPRLAHIHAGRCEDLGIVVYSLAGLRSYLVEPEEETAAPLEMVVGTANVALPDLFNEPFSIHVHESARNKQTYLACAEVGTQPSDDWTAADGLALQLDPQADSNFFGYASLRPAADGGTEVTLVLSAPEPEADAPPAPTPLPGATYSSPSFGYTITYGPTWDVTEETSGNARDRFVLYNGTSYVTFTGAGAFGGDPQSCVDGFVAQLTADPNVSGLGLAADEDGQPLQGGTEATGAYAVYNHDYAFPDRVEGYTLFVGCVPLGADEAVLAIVQNVPTGDYNSQVEPREALLRSLVLPQ